MSGSVGPIRSAREELERLASPENTVDVEIGTRGPALSYERVIDGRRIDEARTTMGVDVGVGWDGTPRGAVTVTSYGSLIPWKVARALYSPEFALEARYSHGFGGEGGAVGGRVIGSTTIGSRVNAGMYWGVDRGIYGDRKGDWGSEIGVSTGINF